MEGFKKSIIAPKSETMTDLLTRITAITVGQGILYKNPTNDPKNIFLLPLPSNDPHTVTPPTTSKGSGQEENCN